MVTEVEVSGSGPPTERRKRREKREGGDERTDGRGYESGRVQVEGHAKVILGGFSLTLFFG